jgi:hypothetical protein
MEKPFIYTSPENHVELRPCLSPVLRKSMFELPHERWAMNPGFSGEPEFWTQIHEGLLSASGTLAAWSHQALEEKDFDRLQQMAPQIKSLGKRLIHHAHGHHHIEDDYFFPVFLKAFPQLQHPLELLDGDHKVLAEVLDALEKAVGGFAVLPAGSDRQKRDAWLSGADGLLPAARRLDALFIRHIGDEEEICIPAMLQG